MIVGSIKENTTLEKRVSLTPESTKNIIGLGLKVCIEKGYALHLGIDDNDYKNEWTAVEACCACYGGTKKIKSEDIPLGSLTCNERCFKNE